MITFPLIVAYNMKEKKIGCALVQAGLGATLSGGDLSFHFDSNLWELSPSKCQLYSINSQTEFDFMKRITKEENSKNIHNTPTKNSQ